MLAADAVVSAPCLSLPAPAIGPSILPAWRDVGKISFVMGLGHLLSTQALSLIFQTSMKRLVRRSLSLSFMACTVMLRRKRIQTG